MSRLIDEAVAVDRVNKHLLGHNFKPRDADGNDFQHGTDSSLRFKTGTVYGEVGVQIYINNQPTTVLRILRDETVDDALKQIDGIIGKHIGAHELIGGVYLAYPIDQRGPASLDYLFQQIESFKRTLIERGLCKWVFDPGDAFRVTPGVTTDDSLPRINRAAANNSDVVVAFLPRGVATVGVPMEIDRAYSQGKHVMVLTDIDESWMLNLPHLWKVAGWEDEAIQFALEWIANLEPPVMTRQHDDLRVKVDVEGCMPKRAYDDDAGLDLIVSKDTHIRLGEFMDVPCGVSVELPGHTWGLVTGRSSAFRKRGLLVLPGVIDAGYRGPLFAGVFAQQHDVDLRQGERIAQLIVMNNATRYVTPVQVEQLGPSMRGTNGFGSSGA